ncbi:uncharacterized protein LOC143298087 [Babylonia areolata]|uniref:uncharacterized protein LOC143298087 n=1 Tax=Babylonia areolata TaxID=304850 RepID=UPI003FD60AE2
MTAMISPSTLKKTATSTVPSSQTVMAALSKANTISSIPVRAIPVPNTNQLILAGPCIVLRTATVAEQVQALRQEKKVAAAASTTTTTTNTNTVKSEPPTPELLRCKRRPDLGKLGFPEAKPASVSRRNARERNRVKLVNQGFDTLREHVPNGKKNRKMSKVDTLRSAVDYIRQLQELIQEHDEKMDVSGSETSLNDDTITITIDNASTSDNTITDDSSPQSDSVCEEAVSPQNDLAPTVTDPAAMTESSVVNNTHVTASESMIMDNLNNNNNNNNKFVNFNVDNKKVVNGVSERLDTMSVDALQQFNIVPQSNTVQQLSPRHQSSTSQQGNDNQQAMDTTNRQQVDTAQQVNTVSTPQLLTNLNSLNTSTFLNTASLMTARTPSTTTQSAQTSTVSASPLPQTITLITLPIQPSPISPSSTDDVFLPETRPRIRTSAPVSQGTVTTGTMATLTTLQGMGSLSGQGLTISQPCRRHLSFSEPDTERTVQIQPRLSLSEPTAQQYQQQQPPSSQQQQQHISFTLLPGHTTGELSLLNGNLNTNTLTLVPQPVSIDQQQPSQQQQQQQQQQPPSPPQFTTLSNLTLPSQSVSDAFSLDQSATSASLPLTDNQCFQQREQFQTLVAPSNVAMKQPQLQVDQVPSPSLSTSSSHTSESSYESYESLGSLEDDLQDISDWITELCNTASKDISVACDTDEGVDLLAYSATSTFDLPPERLTA